MSDTDLTAGETYHNSVSGSTPDGTYEVTNTQDATTGNDPACRKITIETVVAPTRAETVYAICWKDNATHTPSAQCPLTNVSFCVESKRHGDSDSGLTDGVVFVVRQDGKIYATATQSVGVNWKRATGTYTSSQFTWVNGSGNPNFTASGTAIEFGFALKLAVPKDGEPYDVVLFDNLCVILNKACVQLCNTSNCDVLNTGSQSLAVAGTGFIPANPFTITYTTSSSIGNPAGSHKFRFYRGANNPNYTSSAICVATSPVSLPANCTELTGVSICCEIQGEGDSTYFGLTGYAVLGIHQNGYTYFDPAPFQLASPVYAKVGEWKLVSTGLSRSRTSWYRVPDNAVRNGSVVSSGPDFSQSFDIGVLAGSGGDLMVNEGIVYVDNICLKASYGTCVDGSFAANVSGVVLTPKAGAGCNPAWVSQAETNINSTLILTRTTSGCGFSYSGSVGTVPGRVDYSVSISLSGWNGTQFTAGTLLVRAGSGGNNMPATYTLDSPFDPCTETGTFNFVSAVGGASCLILSASGSITVSLI